MSLWRRGVLYLVRKKGRTVLLTILMFMMSCFVVVGLSLKTNADNEAENLRQSLGTGFILKSDTDNEAYYEQREREDYSYKLYVGPRISNEMIGKILDIDGVTDYRVSLSDMVWVNLNLRPGQWANSDEDEYFTRERLELLKRETQILPCRKGEMDTNFKTGALTISEGRNIREGDHYKAVISEWLAGKNGLTVGDTFTVETKEGIFQPTEEPLKTCGEPVELEIIGLFHPNFEQAASDMTYEDGYVVNLIYTDMDTYTKLKKNKGEDLNAEESYTEVTFFVEDPAKLDTVMQQLRERKDIDIDGLIFKADDTAYKASVKPFHQISIFSSIILAAGIAGIGIILYLVMNLWVKGRKQEIGILLSIGIGKWKIVSQMLIECLIVSAAALSLSLLLSGIMIDTCARTAERMTAPKAGAEAYRVEIDSNYNAVVTKTSSDEVKLEHSVSLSTVLLTVVIVCGVSCISVLLASVRILDVEPKRLLQSM